MKPAVLGILALLAGLGAGCAPSNGSDDLADERADLSGTATDSTEYDRWAEVATRAGLTVNRNGEATVVGIRGMSRDGATHGTRSQHAFDDLVVVLGPGHTVVELAMSTHPFETKGVAGVPDVDGDGASDVGMIRPGLYRAVGRGSTRLVGGHSAFDVTTKAGTGKLPGVRDTNHDGTFSDDEAAASTARGDTVTSVLFHHANGGAPAAVGCQVFEEAGIVALITAVGGAKASFDYALVDAASLRDAARP